MKMLQMILPIMPEIFILLMASLILVFGSIFKNALNFSYFAAQLTILIALLLTFFLFQQLNLQAPIFLFDKQFILDKLALVLKIFIYITTLFVFLYSHRYNHEHNIPRNEFYVLGLLSLLGMLVLSSAHNFISVFLGMELMSLPIYAMVALQRGKERSVEAAMKYFVIGAIASGMLLYGMSLLWGVTKDFDLSAIAQLLTNTFSPQNYMILFGLVFIMVGIAFKLGAAPFHMWVPDVYDGAPTSSTLFLSTAPKLAAFALAFRLLVEAMPVLNIQWIHILIVVAVLSIAIGNLVAIVQSNLKRLLAYSSIAHMGYMVLGIVAASPAGYVAALFYLITYVLMTAAAFGIIALMSKAGFEASEISDLSGLNDRNPWLAFLMLLIMFSLAGVPPLVGFIAKVAIFQALIQANLVWLAVVAIIFSIIGAYYYIRVIKVMYFESSLHSEPVHYTWDLKTVITINGLALLALGIFPGPLFALCRWVF